MMPFISCQFRFVRFHIKQVKILELILLSKCLFDTEEIKLAAWLKLDEWLK